MHLKNTRPKASFFPLCKKGQRNVFFLYIYHLTFHVPWSSYLTTYERGIFVAKVGKCFCEGQEAQCAGGIWCVLCAADRVLMLSFPEFYNHTKSIWEKKELSFSNSFSNFWYLGCIYRVFCWALENALLMVMITLDKMWHTSLKSNFVGGRRWSKVLYTVSQRESNYYLLPSCCYSSWLFQSCCSTQVQKLL